MKLKKSISLLLFFALLTMSLNACNLFHVSQNRSMSGIYDNNGGFAYEGHTINLKQDGTFAEWKYTDVLGKTHSERSGEWIAKGELIELIPNNGERFTMHIFHKSFNVFLLSEKQYREVAKNSNYLINIKALKKER